MQKISSSTNTANADGEFTNGNPSAGVTPTYIMAEWLNSVQRELASVLQGAGIALDPTKNDQLLNAIRTINQSASSTFGTDTGTANTILVSLAPSVTAFVDGMIIRVVMASGNSGPTTLSLNALGPRGVVGLGGAPLQGGELVFGGRAIFMWGGSSNVWILLSCQTGALQVAPAVRTQHSIQMGQFQSAAGTFAADTGSTNVIFAVFSPAITALTDGMVVRVLMAVSGNNGATTMSVGTGQKPVLGLAGQPLQGGELVLGGRAIFMYASSQDSWILLSCQSGPLQVKAGTSSLHAVNRGQLGNYNSYAPIGASTAYTAANLGQVFLIQVAGTTQTLPPVAGCPFGTTITFMLNGATTIKGNASELITNTLGTSSPNTMAVLAGEQIQFTSTGTSWAISSYTQVSGRLIGVQVFDTPGTFTYTPTPGMGTVTIKVNGAGAPGGGLTTPNAGNVSMGAPGGSGSFAEGRFTAAQIGASKPVVVGATGTVGLGVSSTNGGSTSVGALISAPGGVGGSALNNVVPGGANGNGANAGTPSGANITRTIGNCTSVSFSVTASIAFSGAGGRSNFGDGGSPPQINGAPVAAVNPGAGGSGCVAGAGGAPQTGAFGGAGIAILMEYSA